MIRIDSGGCIGGSKGRSQCPSSKGPDSFVLTYKFYEISPHRDLMAPSNEVPPPRKVGTPREIRH